MGSGWNGGINLIEIRKMKTVMETVAGIDGAAPIYGMEAR